MIIVSQDKKRTVENLNLGIREAGEYNQNYVIYNTEIGEDLGEYKTEERAKEVLQEIIKQYKELITSYQKGRSDYPIETLMFNRNVYEMPVEKVDDK